MPGQAVGAATERGSIKAIQEIIKRGTRITVPEMAHIATLAEAAGGQLLAAEPDGDWCGTGRIRIKWPAPKDELFNLLDYLVTQYINHEVLINGIINPEWLQINVSRQIGMRKAGF